MKFISNTLRVASTLALMAVTSHLSAQAPVYKTDFSGFIAGVDFKESFGISLGRNATRANFKDIDFGQWGITVNGNDFNGGFARPQKRPATNVKMVGVFLNPADFPAPGKYTINFDLTSDPEGYSAFRAYVYGVSGYDPSGASGGRIDLSLAAPGFEAYSGATTDGDAIVSQLATVVLDLEASSGTVVAPKTSAISIEFTYDGSSIIAFTVGGYNNNATMDNFEVVKASGL